MDSLSATARVGQPTICHRLTIELRPEWTYVSLGPDYRVTASVVAGRILVSRTYGFVKYADIDNYIKFILQVLADSQIKDRPYVHAMVWSDLKGGTIRARNKFASFLHNQSQLRGIAFCGANSLMRMSVRIGERFFPEFPPTNFFANIDDGIRHSGNLLHLDLPDKFDQAPVLVEAYDVKHTAPSLLQLSEKHEQITFPLDDSSRCQLEFQKIGRRILYCHIKGNSVLPNFNIAETLQRRHQAVLHCMASDPNYVEIWNCYNLDTILGRTATRRFFNTLITSSLPLSGFVLIDAGHRIHHTTRDRFWDRSVPYPVNVSTSLTSALLQAYEYLYRSNPTPQIASQPTETHPEWILDDGHFRVENQIINGQIIHTICSGPVTVRNVQRAAELVYPLALEVAASGKPYYVIADMTELSGGSYKARKAFSNALRALYREAPFRMYAVFGATGNLLAGINLGRHKMPFRMFLADHFESALAAVQSDQQGGPLCPNPGNTSEANPAQIDSQHLKQYTDDILHYLGTVNWEPDARSGRPGFADSQHPFLQVFDAIDLLKADLSILYQEQQKTAREQLELETQLARSRKMEALGLLAGGVAHDLNNVLSGIVTYPDVLLNELPKNSHLCEPLQRIRKSGQKAAAIVQDLLTLARRGVNHTTTLNLNSLVEEYIESPEHQNLTTRYPEVTIATELTPNVKEMLGSAVHIKKTIMNLIYNAFEASSANTVVKILTKNLYVDHPIKGYDTVAEGEYVVLDISDQGTGIAPEDLPRIFEPFYTKKKMGRSGTGLGMAVVWGTMQDHQGYIDINTTVGSGTTFSLYFPASEAKVAKLPEKSTPSSTSGHGELVLVVDDTKEQRDFASAVLNLLNYKIKTVNSGEAALAYLRREKADLVLLDMILDPGIDGLETLEQIRINHPRLPVIIATGYADDERMDKTRELCAGQIVLKPYTVQVLGEAICNALHPH